MMRLIGLWLPHDKALHVIAGALSYLVLAALLNPLVGVIGAAVIGVLKEVYDRWHPSHQEELLDIVATAAGGALGYVITLFT